MGEERREFCTLCLAIILFVAIVCEVNLSSMQRERMESMDELIKEQESIIIALLRLCRQE